MVQVWELLVGSQPASHARNTAWATIAIATTQNRLGQHQQATQNRHRHYATPLGPTSPQALEHLAAPPLAHSSLKTRFRLAQTPYNVIIVKPIGNVNMFSHFFTLTLIFISLFFTLYFAFFHFYVIFFQLMLPSSKLFH